MIRRRLRVALPLPPSHMTRDVERNEDIMVDMSMG